MNWRSAIIAILAAGILAAPARAVDPKEATGALFAASDGKGNIDLFWFPPLGRWPAGGWRVADASGKVLIEHVEEGEPQYTKELSPQQAEQLRQVEVAMQKPTAERVANTYGWLGVTAMSDVAFARALGLARTLTNVSPGRRSYRVLALDKGGRPTGVALSSPEVDSSVATPLPPASTNLRAQTLNTGVALYWRPVPANRNLPAIAYIVERAGTPLAKKPIALGANWAAGNPALIDEEPGLEEEATYSVFAVDVFGRRGSPASIKVFVPDVAALQPPVELTAAVEGDRVSLRWTRNPSPHTSGYVVERAYLNAGPFESITSEGLSGETAAYDDRNLRTGTVYFYRVRSMNPRGDLGTPSKTVKAAPLGGPQPPAPQNLRAESGATRARLTWDAVAAPVAGYFIERRPGPAAPWARLNDTVNVEPLYDDRFGSRAQGKLAYRVIAVGFDSQEGPPSATVEIAVPDTAPPPPPFVSDISGADGKVTITFAPGLPADDVLQFLVLRGGSPEDPGLVIGDPLPASARSFVDTHVLPGYDYWYRMTAVDAAGNRSQLTTAIVVRVASPELPTPAPPVAEYVGKPFPHVRLQFAAPPNHLTVVVQRRAQNEGAWKSITEPSTSSEALDANPPVAIRVSYRVVFQAANGHQGNPSTAVQVSPP